MKIIFQLQHVSRVDLVKPGWWNSFSLLLASYKSYATSLFELLDVAGMLLYEQH